MFLLSIAATLAFSAQGPGSASVDDPQSHGTVGDALLSLDEAIQLANGTLSVASLSTAEQARVGSGPVTQIMVDAAMVPVITVQSPLTTLTGPATGAQMVTIMGMAAAGTRPVLAGGSQPTVISIGTRMAMLHGFRFENGGVAIDAQMPAPATPVMGMAMVADCEFDGQSVAAVQLRGLGTDKTRLMVRDSTLTNMPVGFRLDDQTANGELMSENERLTMDGVALGCSAFEGGMGGNATMWALWRSTFVNGQTLARSTRSPTATQLLMLRIVHTDATCSDDVIDMTGTTTGTSMVHHHHGDWVAGPGKRVLWTHPRTAQFDVHGSEMVFDGDIVLSGGLTSPRFWHQNNRYYNCTITLDIDGALPNLLWNRYYDCSIVVPAAARSPVVIRTSEMTNTDVSSQSFLAPLSMQNCYRSGGTMTGFASESNAATATFLGTTEVSPADPQVGSSLDLSTDLPPGILLLWDIATSFARPNTSDEPVRFYGDPNTVIILPAIAIYQSTLTVPIPNSPLLIGEEFYAQGISLPWASVPQAPAYHLPRGGLIKIRP